MNGIRRGENRLKAMITRSEIGQFITPFRLDFAYDYMGRRIMKRYSQYGGDYHDLISTPGGDLKLWAADYELRFVWDTGLSGSYGNLSASYFTDPTDGTFIGADQSYAWGPDLSGTEQGAGGIGGLAIISAAASVLNPTAATYVPLYDGHGNVVSLRDTSTNELAAYTYGPYGETTAAIGSRWASNPFRFSTKFTDAETGLVYYGYRYYLPSVGRWAGRDPIGEEGGLSICAFVGNSPISSTDPIGLFEISVHEEITRTSLNAIRSTGYFADVTAQCWEDLIDSLVRYNENQDIFHLFDLKRHYNRSSTDFADVMDNNYLQYVRSEQSNVRVALSLNYCIDARKAMGHLLHSWQDFFAHSIRRDHQGSAENSSYPGWRAFISGVVGDPENRQNFWPSSWGIFEDLEHPSFSEPVDAGSQEGQARRAAALKYSTNRIKPFLSLYFAKCPCACNDSEALYEEEN